MSDDDRLDPNVLDAWPAMTPPAGFADRVLAVKPPRRRWPLVAFAAAALVAVGVGFALRGGRSDASGVVAVDQRTTVALADRGVVVAEAHSELSWRVDASGAADVEQKSGDVFYRVEHGGPFVIHTPAGDVRVTGTCLRIEVTPMKASKPFARGAIAGGAIGAALASAVLVTVYEGHVIADTRGGKTEMSAGDRVSLSPSGGSVVASAEPTAQVVARQRDEIIHLRGQVATLEKAAGSAAASAHKHDHGESDADDGRLWHDPSPETLANWVKTCHIRFDEPNLDRFTPISADDEHDMHLDPTELAAYNEVMADQAKRWHDLVRALYLEETGDAAGADTLSVDAMRREIDEKSPAGASNEILRELSRERAGLAEPPANPTGESPLERMMRGLLALGDSSEAALAAKLGEARAHEVRGDGWGSRYDMGGCPKN